METENVIFKSPKNDYEPPIILMDGQKVAVVSCVYSYRTRAEGGEGDNIVTASVIDPTHYQVGTLYVSDAQLTSDNEIIAKLGTPKQLARKVLADYSIRENEQAEQKGERRSPRSNANMVWLIILAIASSPITIPVAIVALVMLLLILFLAALFIGIGILLAVVLVGVGLAATVMAIYTGCLMIFSHFFVGLAYLGIGLTGLGLTLVLIPVCFYAIRFLIQLTANVVRYFYHQFTRRRQAKEVK